MRLIKTLLAVSIVVLFTGCGARITERIFTTQPKLALEAGESAHDGKYVLELEGRGGGRDGLFIELHGKDRSNGWLQKEQLPPSFLEKANGSEYVTLTTEAGELQLTGTRSGWSGSGKYRFVPNTAYATAARELVGIISDRQLLLLALSNTSLDYIKVAHGTGLKPTVEDVVRLKLHGMSSDAVRSFARLGFRFEEMTRLRTHGISPEISEGYLTGGKIALAEEQIRLRTHGIGPDLVKEWRGAGFDFGVNEMVKSRTHGVSPEYARAWRSAGFSFGVDELVKARLHGLPENDAGKFAKAGCISLDEMVKLRLHGVGPEYYGSMRESLPQAKAEEITKLKLHGVPPEYVAAILKAGYAFSVEEIIKLRQAGVPTEYVQALMVEGRAPLKAQAIVELKQRGVSAETARSLRK